jgi:hypothetical protein
LRHVAVVDAGQRQVGDLAESGAGVKEEEQDRSVSVVLEVLPSQVFRKSRK